MTPMRRARILAALLASPIVSLASASPTVRSTSSPPTPRSAGSILRKVELRTQDDLVLVGDFYEANAQGRLAPAAVLVHDAGGQRSQMRLVAERLNRLGFAVLIVDLRGHGDSATKDLDWKTLDDAGRKSLWAHASKDLDAAADWLRKQPGIHKTNLSLVGNGSGCALAVRHASRDENVRCVALIGPNVVDFGFDVANDILQIEGLPTCVIAQRSSSDVDRMVAEANATQPFIELFFSSSNAPNAMEDRKTQAKVASWVKDCAMPGR